PTGVVHQKIDQGLTRDLNGNAVSFQYATAYYYDSFGRITSIDGPRIDVTDVTSFGYDPASRALSSVTTLAGTTTFSNFDALGHPGRVTDANGNNTDLIYDGRGRLKQTTDVAR